MTKVVSVLKSDNYCLKAMRNPLLYVCFCKRTEADLAGTITDGKVGISR